MIWEDTRIIPLRNEERKKRYSNLSTGMYIKDQLFHFENYDITEMGFSITLPVGFSRMAQDTVRKKYPSQDSPDIVIGNETGDEVFTFSTLHDHISDEELRKKTADALRIMIKASNPAISFSNDGMVQNDYMSCCWFGFKSYIITGMIYNFLSIVSFENKTYLGMFSCPYDLQPWWHQVYLNIIKTFEVQTGGKYESHKS